ncbi:hypothetical protein LLH03_02820 [bacterium]|nr:hypothetical protein [bacterium]
MDTPTPDDGFWKAVTDQVGDECPAFTAEELARYAEGRMPKGKAQVIKAHLQMCDQCRRLVGELTAEVAPPVSVRYRFEPAVGRRWALASLAATALVLLVVTVLGPGRYLLPPPTAPHVTAPSVTPPSPPQVAPPVPLPAFAPRVQMAAARHPLPRTRRAPRRAPSRPQGVRPSAPAETTPTPPQELVNPIAPSALLAFAEPTSPRKPVTVDLDRMAREGLVNDLDKGAVRRFDVEETEGLRRDTPRATALLQSLEAAENAEVRQP